MYSMETAPRDREIFLRANFSPVDETVFTARGKYNNERRQWVVKDTQPHGLPSLGWMNVNAIGWLDI